LLERKEDIKDQIATVLKRQELPESQEALDKFIEGIRSGIEKQYETLIKNAHQYLCYMYLMTYNYVKCIEHGKKLLKF
jgi:hypothetical protein